jgi:hypothetical protein
MPIDVEHERHPLRLARVIAKKSRIALALRLSTLLYRTWVEN